MQNTVPTTVILTHFLKQKIGQKFGDNSVHNVNMKKAKCIMQPKLTTRLLYNG